MTKDRRQKIDGLIGELEQIAELKGPAETAPARRVPHEVTIVGYTRTETGALALAEIVETSRREASFFVRQMYRNDHDFHCVAAIAPGEHLSAAFSRSKIREIVRPVAERSTPTRLETALARNLIRRAEAHLGYDLSRNYGDLIADNFSHWPYGVVWTLAETFRNAKHATHPAGPRIIAQAAADRDARNALTDRQIDREDRLQQRAEGRF